MRGRLVKVKSAHGNLKGSEFLVEYDFKPMRWRIFTCVAENTPAEYRYIHTTPVTKVVAMPDRIIFETKNSTYELWEMGP